MIVLSKGLPENTALCERCGEQIPIPVPLSITAFAKWVEFQEEKHKTCKPTEAL